MTPEEREYANDNMAEADLLLREVRRLLREVRRDFDRVLARVDELEAENARLDTELMSSKRTLEFYADHSMYVEGFIDNDYGQKAREVLPALRAALDGDR